MKSDVSFYFKQRVVLKKWRVVSLQTTCRFTCCETSWLKRKKRGPKCLLWHLWQQKK